MNNTPSEVSVVDDEKQARWDGPGFQPTAEPKPKPRTKAFNLFDRAVIDGQRSGRLPGDVEPRKAKIEIRVSERERAAYLERASAAGFRSVSDWIRSKVDEMHSPAKGAKPTSKSKPAHKATPKKRAAPKARATKKARRTTKAKAPAKAKRAAKKSATTKRPKASGRASGRRRPFVGTNRSAKTGKKTKPARKR